MAENDYIYDAPSIDTTPGGDSVKSSILEKNQARVEQSLTLLNSHKNRTDSHGTTSPIVGVDDEQTLTNKTFVDPVITYSAEPAGTAPVTREWVENQGDLAVNQARTARDEAVQARDEAVAAKDIAVDAAKTLKITPEPVLVGDVSGNEGEDLVFNVTNHKEEVEYQVSVTGGTVSAINGVITWALPSVEVDTDFILTVYASKLGFQQSSAVTKTVSVKNVPIQDGPTMIFADTTEGYPGATVTDGVVSAPAHSVGLNNTKQIVSAKPEIMVTSGRLNISNVSESGFDLDVAYKGPIVTDQGEGDIVSIAGGGGVVETKPFDGISSNGVTLYNTRVMLDAHIPNGKTVTELGVQTSTTPTIGGLGIYRRDDTNKFTPVAFVSGVATTPGGVYNYLALDKPYAVPSSGEYYVGVSNTVNAYKADGVGGGVYSMTEASPVEGTQYTFPTSNEARIFVAFKVLDSYTATLAEALPGVPTKAFKNPYKEPLTLKSATTTSIITAEKVTEGETLFVPERVTAGAVTEEMLTASGVDKADFFNDGSAVRFFQFNNSLVDAVSGKTMQPNAHGYAYNSSGKFGGCITGGGHSFTDGESLEIPYADSTISYWYKIANANYQVQGLGWGPQSTGGYMYCGGSGYVAFDQKLIDTTLNKWNHMCIVTSAAQQKVYNNGVLVHTFAKDYTKSGPYTFGSAYSGQNDYSYIDQVRAFSRQCTADEIAQLYAEESKSMRYNTDLTHESLSSAPSYVARKKELTLKVGAGAAGEYLGPEKELVLVESKVLPVMTDTTTGGFTMSQTGSGTDAPAPWRAWNAADGDPATVWQRSDGTGDAGIEISGPFSDPVTRIDIQARSAATATALKRLPKDFTFKGYDGNSWVTLKAVTGEVGWQSEEKRSFSFSNGTTYQKYWLDITATESGTVYREIGELALFYDNSSSTTEITIKSDKSIKDQIFTAGGLHNNLIVDGSNVVVNGVSESVVVMPTITNTNKNAVPIMSGTTTGNYTVKSNASTSANYFPYKAFDGSSGSLWLTNTPGWLKIVKTSPFSIWAYTLTCRNASSGPSQMPKNWTFEGSNDGSNWTVLDTQSGHTWSMTQKKEFQLADVATYSQYRINITATGGASLEISGMELLAVVSGAELEDQGTYIYATPQYPSSTSNPFANPDNDTSSFGFYYNATPETDAAWFGAEFPVETKITGLNFFQHATTQYGVTSAMIQSSSDGIVWQDQQLFTGLSVATDNLNVLTLNTPFTARYARCIAKADTTGVGWVVYHARWYGQKRAVITTTINLKTALPEPPTIDGKVAIPDRCTLSPDSYACALDGSDLKVTGAEIALEDNPKTKRLVMAVSGDEVTFKSGKIYIKEKP
ncbi:LamG-like jellyroll fold domain-containing protein [Maridesulfovibrio sp.]|uniref:LamG-like jellyroll fold domain-containing protein n=1 Tax=Maridesulfovibrio sp. TaxID=2795000 RepID=UPI003BAB0CBC